MEDFIGLIIMAAIILYNVFLSKPKKKKRRPVPPQQTQVPMPQQQAPASPGPVAQPSSLEDLLRRMKNQDEAEKPKPAPVVVEPEKEVFTYDSAWEGPQYEKRKIEELKKIRDTRLSSRHLESNIHDENLQLKRKKKKRKKLNFKDFHFDPKAAVIYTEILKRKY